MSSLLGLGNVGPAARWVAQRMAVGWASAGMAHPYRLIRDFFVEPDRDHAGMDPGGNAYGLPAGLGVRPFRMAQNPGF